MKNFINKYKNDRHELSPKDIKMMQGVGAVMMVLLHLFMRVGQDVYGTPLIWLNDTTPLVYLLGYIGGPTVVIFALCSGYAHFRLGEKNRLTFKQNVIRIFKFLQVYWIVLVLFVLLELLVKGKSLSLIGFIKMFFLVDKSFNPAWWYAATYCYLVLFSRIFFFLVKKVNPLLVLIFAVGQYALQVLLIYYLNVNLSSSIPGLNYFLTNINNLFGHTMCGYLAGMVFARTNLISFVTEVVNKIKFKKIIYSVLYFALIITTTLIGNLFVYNLSGLVVFIMFFTFGFGKVMKKVFSFLGKHSINIWLTHMFFYLVMFPGLVQKAKYPIFMFAFMMLLCILSSYVILFVKNLIDKIINSIIKKTKSKNEVSISQSVPINNTTDENANTPII